MNRLSGLYELVVGALSAKKFRKEELVHDIAEIYNLSKSQVRLDVGIIIIELLHMGQLTCEANGLLSFVEFDDLSSSKFGSNLNTAGGLCQDLNYNNFHVCGNGKIQCRCNQRFNPYCKIKKVKTLKKSRCESKDQAVTGVDADKMAQHIGLSCDGTDKATLDNSNTTHPKPYNTRKSRRQSKIAKSRQNLKARPVTKQRVSQGLEGFSENEIALLISLPCDIKNYTTLANSNTKYKTQKSRKQPKIAKPRKNLKARQNAKGRKYRPIGKRNKFGQLRPNRKGRQGAKGLKYRPIRKRNKFGQRPPLRKAKARKGQK